MSLLTKCTPSRLADFLIIPDDSIPKSAGEDADLFVGRNKSVTLTLSNETETKLRDIVVLGQLNIRSSNPNSANQPRLVARDFFSAGRLSVTNIHINCRNFSTFKNLGSFERELQELVLDWLEFQRECAKRSGLISILI